MLFQLSCIKNVFIYGRKQFSSKIIHIELFIFFDLLEVFVCLCSNFLLILQQISVGIVRDLLRWEVLYFFCRGKASSHRQPSPSKMYAEIPSPYFLLLLFA